METDPDRLQMEALIASDIAMYGFHIGFVAADNHLPGYAYTIGLHKTFGHPEVICFGLPPETLGELLNHAGYLVEKGYVLTTGCPYADFLTDRDVRFVHVAPEHYAAHLQYAGTYYRHWDFPVLQLVWPDAEGFFPWQSPPEPGWRQPLLNRSLDFGF